MNAHVRKCGVCGECSAQELRNLDRMVYLISSAFQRMPTAPVHSSEGKARGLKPITSIVISFLLQAREELSYFQEPLKA